jgi:hypothetical protein
MTLMSNLKSIFSRCKGKSLLAKGNENVRSGKNANQSLQYGFTLLIVGTIYSSSLQVYRQR